MSRAKTRPKPPRLTQALLERRCRYWQKVLGLQDWTIKVSLERHENMEADEEAECKTYGKLKLAVVKIIHPDHYPTDQPYPQDWEDSLVHELLHIHLDPLGPFPGLKEVALEQAVVSITRGFIALHRAR